MNYIEVMKKRRSVRTYSEKAISQSDTDLMTKFLENVDNPFDADVRFSVVNTENAPEKLGTYGFIRGAKTFILGCLKPSAKDIEGFGYAFEKVILNATSIGLGTCWMGGTFKRGVFERAANLEAETMPAASPLGYIKEKRSIVERVVAAGAGARKRIAFDELFFDGDFTTSLDLPDSDLRTCLEMVRIAPSASNKQPWRVVKDGDNLHFYLAKTKNYAGNSAFGFVMQRIDLGIAACHFELAARELQLSGKIVISDPKIPTEYNYSFTWEG